ncbi:hypothetical protein E2C01_008849 [Portunus trituberculatus]|uniref:Uncharacterized protein n=1 Tax=Portunus trituberculatus TaxID=210409 RepID=A0A5B7D340_PORTR|nr:hypothetical protein [Portunus trituberculatus]
MKFKKSYNVKKSGGVLSKDKKLGANTIDTTRISLLVATTFLFHINDDTLRYSNYNTLTLRKLHLNFVTLHCPQALIIQLSPPILFFALRSLPDPRTVGSTVYKLHYTSFTLRHFQAIMSIVSPRSSFNFFLRHSIPFAEKFLLR